MLLKCECCGTEGEFRDGEHAFDEGWDAPPRFTGYVACNLCPAVAIVLKLGHTKAHEYWKKHGRPEKFGPTCFTDNRFSEGWDPSLISIAESLGINLDFGNEAPYQDGKKSTTNQSGERDAELSSLSQPHRRETDSCDDDS